ncbi:ABC transporter ATP-binding protein [Paenilisteria rocourtiae]|uniref:ABC-2 type transport system ATP-binding protein n=1 Tax=Listeria rocourtiae TaxID=647910 RepID=A0A4R6ZF06_9LIST|nr:ABC transporter ATP-binding protein [Listeria rocourtiae]EUJ46500.1 ABC transporter ATP-binding protein [Listeria rocourtiae FSL F6-920]MBC1433928.1 ABC transporter ATP-binding protein [Listeria rocourtiae]MBC1605920.1 ABC transporter ATP-binding protein [Listeria rocourtiae]TDR50582.1 ABC-2 type transport system ATP-binding protein [Listeria rocourtiae]
MEKILEVTNLSKRFEDYQAVKDIDFQLVTGECVALLGPNGAGKTTILKMIVDMINPNSGEIQICGGKHADMKRQIGFLPQYPNFYGWMTATEALQFMGKLSEMDKKDLSERIPEVLAQVGLDANLKQKIATFSGGMRQRLGIAQAILHRPALLIMDEPVSALDPIGRREIIQLIQSLKGKTTLLFSTHILADVEEVCERVCIIREGEIVADDRIANLVQANAASVFVLRSDADTTKFELAIAKEVAISRMEQKHGAIYLHYQGDVGVAREAILRVLMATGIAWTSVSQAQETLEDVFLRMVEK